MTREEQSTRPERVTGHGMNSNLKNALAYINTGDAVKIQHSRYLYTYLPVPDQGLFENKVVKVKIWIVKL